MELDSEPSELNYEGGEEPIYDSHQREKSTGSGLVLAVPAMVLDPEDTETQGIRVEHRGGGVVVSGGEYENLVADNQYYEQVEFGKLAAGRLGRQASHVMEDSLYSIPQVSSNNSTTGLTTNLVKVKRFFCYFTSWPFFWEHELVCDKCDLRCNHDINACVSSRNA